MNDYQSLGETDLLHAAHAQRQLRRRTFTKYMGYMQMTYRMQYV